MSRGSRRHEIVCRALAVSNVDGCVVVAVRAGNFGGWDQAGAHRVIETLDELTPSLVEALARDYGVDR